MNEVDIVTDDEIDRVSASNVKSAATSFREPSPDSLIVLLILVLFLSILKIKMYRLTLFLRILTP